MKIQIGSYALGVVTAPVWFYVFRKPLMEHVILPFIADEDLDESMYKIMMNRNDLKDKRKKAKDDEDMGKP